MPIIRSILDNDLYKFTMQQAVLELHPNVHVTYQFNNRRKDDKFTPAMLKDIVDQISQMKYHELTENEYHWLRKACPYFKETYFQYIKNYRFNPDEIVATLEDDDLKLTISGLWHRTILWEVPLMAIISEVYFHHVPNGRLDDVALLDYYTKTSEKRTKLTEAGCLFSDFGTRRRRSFQVQDMCVKAFKTPDENCNVTNSCFTGTSNVHLAREYSVNVIGTMAHEWIMGTSALRSLKHANRYALEDWAKVYNGELGVALTDTFGTEAFFNDFDGYLGRLYDGVRHDSGNPYAFADKIIAHYRKLGINPMFKKIVFSDGLDVEEAIKIKKHCEGKINVFFGIGTHFTNDVPGSKALNMVIKLRTVDGVEVVKISDNPIKATGDLEALNVAFKTFKLN